METQITPRVHAVAIKNGYYGVMESGKLKCTSVQEARCRESDGEWRANYNECSCPTNTFIPYDNDYRCVPGWRLCHDITDEPSGWTNTCRECLVTFCRDVLEARDGSETCGALLFDSFYDDGYSYYNNTARCTDLYKNDTYTDIVAEQLWDRCNSACSFYDF